MGTIFSVGIIPKGQRGCPNRRNELIPLSRNQDRTLNIFVMGDQIMYSFVVSTSRWLQAPCSVASAADTNGDAGYSDAHQGWYDIDGCGICNNYCRWRGNCGSRGAPTTDNPSCSIWSCVVYDNSTSSAVNSFNMAGPSWGYSKCSGKGAQAPTPEWLPPRRPWLPLCRSPRRQGGLNVCPH